MQVELSALSDPRIGRLLTDRGHRLTSFQGVQVGSDRGPPPLADPGGQPRRAGVREWQRAHPSGDLWVVDEFSDTVVEYSPSELTASGGPAPVDTIAGPSTGINNPWVLAIGPTGSSPAGGGTGTAPINKRATSNGSTVALTAICTAVPCKLSLKLVETDTEPRRMERWRVKPMFAGELSPELSDLASGHQRRVRRRGLRK